MATQLNTYSIAPLMAVTLLTSICTALPGETRAFDLSAQSAIQPNTVDDSGPRNDAGPSADAVADARWAKPHDDYVLGEGGRISPEGSALEETTHTLRDDGASNANHDHFDVVHPPAEVQCECGLSPAAPNEIRRLVIKAAQRHKVDVGFAIAIVTAESRLDQLRNSPEGARGPMQLMPQTAERFGVIDICDPEENIDGGIRYLSELADEFRNPLLVAAAYNVGEGRVREHGGIPPFKETIGYVAEVLNIQMGLEETCPIAREPDGSGDEQPSNVSGVITSRERRQWVGGVMHF